MQTRSLGRPNLKVSAVGLGCNNFGRIDLDASRRVVHKALDLGITLFDTADVYGNGKSEEYLGEILGARRKHVVLLTKFGMNPPSGRRYDASRKYMHACVNASLKRLNTDHIDIYMVHWFDPKTPLEETLRGFDDLIRAGKIRYAACSNYAAWQVVKAQYIAKEIGLHRFVAAENEYSLLARSVERELLPALSEFGIGFLPYFPLASGLLTGKYKRNAPLPEGSRLATSPQFSGRVLNDTNWNIVEGLEKLAARQGHTLLDLAFAWLLTWPTVSSVIAGATKPEQVEANVKASAWVLNAEVVAEADEISRLAPSPPPTSKT